MNQEDLRSYLEHLIGALENANQELLRVRLESLVSAFPFNEYEYILTFLVDRRVISFNEYEVLRNNYVSANRYLDLFSLAPRVFGQIWGEKHVMDLDKRFEKPNKNLDPDYNGQYDLWIEGGRVEVKAARAIHTRKRGNIASKALRWGEEAPFWMNYQQLKLDICDVFVFIGVWVDLIVYWVMTNEEVKNCKYRSHQHRSGIEYQIGIRDNNIQEFDGFKVEASGLAATIIAKSED